MPNNRNGTDKERSAKDVLKVHEKKLKDGRRQDVSLPWDKEWLKGKRDDRPLTDQPMPENPLKLLKDKGLKPKNGTETDKNEGDKTSGS